MLLEGQIIALVSDAGLPAISDPGYDLVRMAVEAGRAGRAHPRRQCGLVGADCIRPADRAFCLRRFSPAGRKRTAKVLEGLQHVQDTLLFYESPHRVEKTLLRMAEVWGRSAEVCLARELTKRYEEFLRGTIAECLAHLEQYPPQGEYCVIAEGASDAAAQEAADGWWEAKSLGEHVAHYEARGIDRKDAMKQVATDRGLSKRDVYNALLERMQ